MSPRTWMVVGLFASLGSESALQSAEPPLHFAHPRVAPDGRHVALDCGLSGALDLCLYDLSARRLYRLTSTPGVQEAVPAFSPDGGRIAFSLEHAGTWFVATLDLATGTIARLHELALPHATICAWAPDGERIAFHERDEAGEWAIFSIGEDGTGLEELGSGPRPRRFPAFSPDGRRMAWIVSRDGAGDIFVAESNGGGARPLAPSASDEILPAWAPDGESLVYVSDRAGNPEIYLSDLEGTERRLTHDPAQDIMPAFALDGGAIVFESTRERDPTSYERGADLFLLDLTRGKLERLTAPSDLERAPPWNGVASEAPAQPSRSR